MAYFDKFESAADCIGCDPKRVVKRIAQRYMADNPTVDVALAASYDKGFKRDRTCREIIDFNKIYPDAPIGSYAYAYGYLIPPEGADKIAISVSLKSEAWIYVNKKLVAQTTIEDENPCDKRNVLIDVNGERCGIFVKCRKNEAGFGCTVGHCTKWVPLFFYTPFNNNGLGVAFTKAFDEDIYENSENIPELDSDADENWFPKLVKRNPSSELGIYHTVSYFNGGGKLYAKSVNGARVYIDGNAVTGETYLPYGEHYVFTVSQHDGKAAEITQNGVPCQMFSKVRGSESEYIVSPKLTKEHTELIQKFNPSVLLDTENGKDYWKTDECDVSVRASIHLTNFGRWNYPLGVVIYGLTEAARAFDDDDIKKYVDAHMAVTDGIYEYSVWDNARYGFPSVVWQIADIDSLDDCGSFSNAVLNYRKEVTKSSETVFDYITNKQERLADGLFYREAPGTISEQTVWADDAYMSLPFLCRYYELTKDNATLSDIENQILKFKEYLYMPEKKLLSHIYSVKYKKITGIHWGRGNAWVLFTLSEILRIMPKDRAVYSEVLDFYTELCEGFYNSIDDEGMLHQLLNDHESYMEASATAICITAFARGVKNGWLTDEKYRAAAHKMWEALCRHCIKYNGDLYGVCRGSGFSFREEYYKNELPWCINDTHGTGVVILAAAEIAAMDRQ